MRVGVKILAYYYGGNKLPLSVFMLSLIFSLFQSPCENTIDRPVYDPSLYCLEQVIDADSEMAYTALAVAPDGRLYAASPLTGEVFIFEDSNGDLLPDTPHSVAQGLNLPNTLAFHEDTLYIAGGAFIHRLRNGELETLVDDLPTGGGFWTGGLAVHERLYVGIGANCDNCQPEKNRGIILSYALDGTDRQIVAEGFKQPAGLIWYRDALWAVDTGLSERSSDELNRIIPGGHYGFPNCFGLQNRPVTPEINCESVQPPVLVFPNQSNPLAIAAYDSDTFPQLNNTLLVILGGTTNTSYIRGYALVSVYFDAEGNPTGFQSLLPADDIHGLLWSRHQLAGFGFFPHHIYGVAVNPEGWIYVSSGGGQILLLRPR